MNQTFKDELAARLSAFGDAEFHRRMMRPTVIALLEKHGVTHEELMENRADEVIEEYVKSHEHSGGDPRQGTLFRLDQLVALGEGVLIKRGAMDEDQIIRRCAVLDLNLKRQINKHAAEMAYYSVALDRIRASPSDASFKPRIMDVMPNEPTNVGTA